MLIITMMRVGTLRFKMFCYCWRRSENWRKVPFVRTVGLPILGWENCRGVAKRIVFADDIKVRLVIFAVFISVDWGKN